VVCLSLIFIQIEYDVHHRFFSYIFVQLRSEKEGGIENIPDRQELIGCPTLDAVTTHLAKFIEIFGTTPIKRVTCRGMQVPCCGGMTAKLKQLEEEYSPHGDHCGRGRRYY